MPWQTLYHRVFAVAVACGLWAYALFCFSLGRFFLPVPYGGPPGTLLWSDQRPWFSIPGTAGYLCMIGLMAGGAGMLLLPAPAASQEQWHRQARYESAAKVLLLAGGALIALGICGAWLGGLTSVPPGRGTLPQVRLRLQQDQWAQRRFDAWKFLWGGLYALLLVGGLIDLVLRRRAGPDQAA